MKTNFTSYKSKSLHFIRSIVVFCLFMLSSLGFAADYYWVGGSGDWSDHSNHWATTSGGAVFHPSVPSQFDNVIFDANSFTQAGQTVTVSYESFCNTFDSRDVIPGVIFNCTRALHVYNGMEIDQNLSYTQNGNLTLYDGGLTVGDGNASAPVSFSVSGTVNLDNGPVEVADYSSFNHSGSIKVVTGDAHFGQHTTTTLRSMTLQDGSLIVDDNATFNGHHLHINGGNASLGNHVNFYDYGEFRINSGSLTIGDNTSFRQDHHTLWVAVGNLEMGTNSTYFRYGGSTYVRDGDLIIGDNSSYRCWSHTQVNNGSFTVGQDVEFRIEGGYNNQIWNGDFTLGANTTYFSHGHTYLYTGAFNWDNTNPITNYGTIYLNSGDFHLTSGVNFTSTGSLRSANGSLIVDSGVTATIRGNVQLTNGTIDLDPAANLTWWADLYLRSTQSGQFDVNSGGRDLKRIQFDGTNYNTEYNFTDDVKASSDGIFMYANKINFNGYGVDVSRFYSWTSGVVSMDLTGTDTVRVVSEFRMYPSSNTQLTMGDATIKWDGTSHQYFYAGYNKTYNDLYFNSNNTGGTVIQFEGNTSTIRDVFIKAKGTQYMNMYNNFTVRSLDLEYLNNSTATPNLNFSGNWNVSESFKVRGPSGFKNNIYSYSNNTFNVFDVPAVNQWILRANTTQTFTELKPISGTCDETVTIKGESLGVQGSFSMASGTFNGDWLILQDVNATGGGDFIADNTVDLGNVNGWTVNVIAPRDFYWVGGNGSWNVASNWSDVSGGTPGNCGIPNRTDNAIFDANSFSSSGQFVNINVPVECKDMIWDNVTPGSGINGNNHVNIYGSLALDQNMAFNHGGTFYFQSVDDGNTIKTEGIQMRQVIFSGQNQNSGEWTLLDDFNAHSNWFYFQRGTLFTNGNNIDVYGFYAWYNHPGKIDFDNDGTITVQHWLGIYPSYTMVESDSLDVVFDSHSHFYFYGGNHIFRDMTFNARNTGGSYIEMQGNNSIRDVSMECYGAQWMRVYHTSTYRDFEINYYKDHPWNQQVQFWHSSYKSMTINGIGNNRPWVYFHGNNTLGDVSLSNLRGLYFGGLQTMDSFTPLAGRCDQLLQFWGGNGVSMATGSFDIDWATMWNLTASGGATFNATNVLGTSYNLNGWNLDNIPPTNFYWVGGSGNWNDANHWSYTSGGTPGVCPVPGRFDNVFFDVNSFSAPNQYVNLNTTAEFNNMLWTNVNHPRLIGGGQMNVYGSFQLDENLTYQATGWVFFRSRTDGNVVKTAGKKLYYVRFDGEGQSTGEWTLKDDLSLHYDLYIDRGTFISDSSNISSRMFYCWTGSPTTVDLTGTEYVEVKNQFRIYPNNFNLIMDNADVRFTGTNHFYFIGGNNTFNDVEMIAANSGNSYIEFQYNNLIDNVKIVAEGNQTMRFYHNSTYNDVDIQFQNLSSNIPYVYFHGSNTINDLSITSIGNAGPYIYLNNNNTFNNLVSAGVGTRLYPAANRTQQVNDLLAIGSGGFPVFFQSQTPGSQATFYKPSGTVCLDYVWMRDINAISDLDSIGNPATEFFAGNNSVDLGDNSSNWMFSSCDGFYWVGGSGGWSETAHWATSSGGTQTHGTLPTQFDNVFFDANSFTSGGEVVTIDIADPRCQNMSWSSSLFTPTLAGSGDVNVYGSLRFISNMNMDFTGDFNFKSDQPDNEINSGGHTLTNMNFIGGNDGEGAWKLVNHLDVSNSINLSNGELNTNNKDINTRNFNSSTINTRKLSLGSSALTINDGQWNPSDLTNFTFEKGTSRIIVTGSNSSDFFGNGLDYHDVIFRTPAQLDSRLSGANTFNTLQFEAGVAATLDPVVQEASQIYALGSCDRNITLQSETPGSAAVLKQTSGTVEGRFLTLEDNTATGGAVFNANLSNDLGNVNGWTFTSAPVIAVIEEVGLVDCELNNDGWAKVTVVEGIPPFNYLWSTSETTDSIGGLIPGTYYVTVTDSIGCSITEEIDVLNKPSALEPISFTMSDDQICLGTPIEFQAGDVISNALNFDGSDDFVALGDHSSMSPTSMNPVTFEAWIKPASSGTGTIASKFDDGAEAQSNFLLGLNNGNLQVSADGTDYLLSASAISITEWTHIAVVFESGSGNTIIYINGVYDNSGTLTYNSVNGSSGFVLGAGSSGTNDYYSGLLDEVRVWDTIRSSSDIFENMTVPQSGLEDGLTAYYRLDELTGSTSAVDQTPNAFDGALTNMDAASVWIAPGAFTPAVTYSWDFGDFTAASGQNVSHTYSAYGTYTVALSTYDDTGCPNIVEQTVVVSQVGATVVYESVQCFGAANGSIIIEASGGVEPYSYSIDGGLNFSQSGMFTDLDAGTYSVFVKDAIACESAVQNVVLTQPAAELEFSTTSEHVECADDENGSISVTASGGTPPYQYSLNGGISYQPSNVFTDLLPGEYTIKIRDANNCSPAAELVVVEQVDLVDPEITCPADIAVNVSEMDGCFVVVEYPTPGATDNCELASVELTEGLASGSLFPVGVNTVTYTATDAAGNQSTCSFTIEVVDAQAPVAVCKDIEIYLDESGNASISADAINDGSYDNCDSVILSVSLSEFTCANLGENSVILSVSDPSGNASTCTAIVTVVDTIAPVMTCIDVPQERIANNAGCSYAVVGDEFTPTEQSDNCQASLSYVLSGATTGTGTDLDGALFNLGLTTITWTLLDVSGNSTSCDVEVTVINDVLPVIEGPDIVCAGSASAEYTTEAGMSNYIWEISDGGTITSGGGASDNSVVITWITPGPQTVSVNYTNANGCTANEPTVLDLYVSLITVTWDYVLETQCPNGTFYTLTGGLPEGGTYSGPGVIGDNFDATLAGLGTHELTYTYVDVNGCTNSQTNFITVEDLTLPTISCVADQTHSTDPTVCSYTVMGSEFDPAAFDDNCAGAFITNDFNGLASLDGAVFDKGITSVTWIVTDFSGNTQSCSFIVTVLDDEAPAMTCISDLQDRTPNFEGCSYVEVNGEFTPAGLSDNCSGEFTLEYTLSGATTGSGTSLDGVAFNLGVTTITWTLTDDSFNQTSCSFVVSLVNDLETTISSPVFAGGFNIRCFEGSDGSVDLGVSGGTEPYSYTWSNGAATEDLSDVPAGTYDVVVTDIYGCAVETSITLTEPELLVADAGSDLPICYTFNTEIGGLPSASGGVEPYTYEWSPAEGLSDPSIANPIAGPMETTFYTLTVTDQNGCIAVSSMVLTVNPLPEASIVASSADDFCNGVTLTAYSSTTENEYLWSRGDFDQSIFLSSAVDQPGVYTVYVTDQNGCTSPEPAEYVYEPENLTSSYTILGFKEVHLGENNVVESGSVGLTGVNRKAHIKKGAEVASPGSFVKADQIEAHPTANILNAIYDPVTTVLPTMYYNTNGDISGKIEVKKNTTTTIDVEYVDIIIKENCDVTITGSVYGKIEIGKGSSVVFTSSSIYLEKLKVEGKQENTPSVVEFSQDAQVMVKEKVEVGKYISVNPTNSNVVFYIGEEHNGHKGDLKVKAVGTSFNASVYAPRGQIHVQENAAASNTGTMTGQFIAEKIHSSGKNITWNWHSCNALMPAAPLAKADSDRTNPTSVDAPVINVYPVPNNGLFTSSIYSPTQSDYTISVFNSQGALLYQKKNVAVDANDVNEQIIDLKHVISGVYHVIVHNHDHYVVTKVIVFK